MSVVQIAIANIDIGQRKRLADRNKVSALADSIQRVGLLNPITVRLKPGDDQSAYLFSLIAGLHRLEAFTLLGRTEIPATVLTLDDLQAQLAEIDENLVRSNLTILQESLWLVERKTIYEALYPETRQGAQGGGRGGNGVRQRTENDILTFSVDTANQTGVKRRGIERRIQIGEQLLDMADQLIGASIEDNQTELLKLVQVAQSDPDRARAVAAKIKAQEAEHVQDALNLIEQARQRQVITQLAETMPDVSDRYRLTCADLRSPDWATWDIAPDSVDAVITDPPYERKYLLLYSVLAQRAAVWLKPGGSLVAMGGQSYLFEIGPLMMPHLDYQWTLSYQTPGGQSPQIWPSRVNTFWKPVFWFVKGQYNGPWLGDVVKSDVNGNDKRFHHWGQSESGMAALVERFTKPGDLVLDPFCGGGTTGAVALALNRRFAGIDIDQSCIETTAYRLGRVEFVDQPERS